MADFDVADAIRIDRVATLEKFGFWKHLPQGPVYGDLVLTPTAVHFVGVARFGEEWTVARSEVTKVRPYTESDMDAYSRTMTKLVPTKLKSGPQRGIHADWGGKARVVLFTGVVSTISKVENAIGHVPGVHHAGALAIAAKKQWDNRGSALRAGAAYEAWIQELGLRP